MFGWDGVVSALEDGLVCDGGSVVGASRGGSRVGAALPFHRFFFVNKRTNSNLSRKNYDIISTF